MKHGKTMKQPPDKSPVLNDGTAFSIREAYNTLRTNILLSFPSGGCKLIGVTSAQPLEGKSISCLNAAITFAQLEARVLLIDCDLRIPRQAKLLDLKAGNGLSNLLVRMCSVEEVIQKNVYPNLDVILSGDIPPSPTELLGSKNMEALLETLSQKYDYILVDLPPINIVADTIIMSKLLTGILLVVRSGMARRDNVIAAINKLELAQANIIGVLLNGVINKRIASGRYDYSL